MTMDCHVPMLWSRWLIGPVNAKWRRHGGGSRLVYFVLRPAIQHPSSFDRSTSIKLRIHHIFFKCNKQNIDTVQI